MVRDLDDDGKLLWIPDSKTEAGRRTLQVPELLRPMLKALAEGKLRTLLVNADHESPGFRCASGRLTLTERECGSDGKGTPVVDVIDEALEEALRQRVSVEVVRSPEAAARVDGLAGLLRFK